MYKISLKFINFNFNKKNKFLFYNYLFKKRKTVEWTSLEFGKVIKLLQLFT